MFARRQENKEESERGSSVWVKGEMAGDGSEARNAKEQGAVCEMDVGDG